MKTTYVVHYGDCTSTYRTTKWREAAAYIKYCLANGTRVREVTTERGP